MRRARRRGDTRSRRCRRGFRHRSGSPQSDGHRRQDGGRKTVHSRVLERRPKLRRGRGANEKEQERLDDRQDDEREVYGTGASGFRRPGIHREGARCRPQGRRTVSALQPPVRTDES